MVVLVCFLWDGNSTFAVLVECIRCSKNLAFFVTRAACYKYVFVSEVRQSH